MDTEMLSDIVARALKRTMKWCPPTLEPNEIENEAWVAVLEAVQAGEIDPKAIQKTCESHIINRVMAPELKRLRRHVQWPEINDEN